MSRIEPVILLLAWLLVFFTALLFMSEKFFPTDGQFFQVISGLLTGISGALLKGIKNQLGLPDTPPGSTSTVTEKRTVQVDTKEEAR